MKETVLFYVGLAFVVVLVVLIVAAFMFGVELPAQS